jgi:hypothetical protein
MMCGLQFWFVWIMVEAFIGGGDFGFGSVGHVLQFKHSDVIVYNPTHPH